MLHWYRKMTIIWRKIKNTKETIIVRWRKQKVDILADTIKIWVMLC